MNIEQPGQVKIEKAIGIIVSWNVKQLNEEYAYVQKAAKTGLLF